MGYFSRYRKYYKEPERFTSSEARANRLTAMLERDRRFADLPNFVNVKSALSQAPKNSIALEKINVNDQKAFGHKAALIAAALSNFSEKDFGDPRKRAAYRALRLQQEALRASRSKGGRQKANVPGGDKRFYNPTGKSFAARVSGVVASMYTPSYAWQQVFKNPGSVIPCIQREVRRQVMFAKGHGGRGYRVKHRRTWSSGVPC